MLFLTILTPLQAQTDTLSMDSVEISLLTCEPHDEVYSLYGHTAIRYHDLRPGGYDIAFNYGVFNFHAPYFALRFVFGMTDYELGAYPYRLFLAEYRHFGSQVTEQVLNLTNDEKLKLRDALAENLRDENKIYRYNYFYNNCTTKARDIIEQSVSGRVEYTDNKPDTKTYRMMVHEMTRNHPWSRFGNDLLLGYMADRPITQRQQEFLPHYLMNDFSQARIISDKGQRPLVAEQRVALPSGTPIVQEGFPLSPRQCGFILLAVGILLIIAEFTTGRIFILWDVLLMVITGIIGLVLFLMLFSQHPTVSVNFQLSLFNPLPWFFLWPVIRRRQTHYWTITVGLVLLFFILGLFQDYAEGLWSLALCLLMQSSIHIVKARQ